MQGFATVIASLLLTSGAVGLAPVVGLPSPGVIEVLDVARALVEASSWTERFLAVAELDSGPVPVPVPSPETRPIASLVADVYAHLGVSLSEEERTIMAAQAAALPAGVASALQQLLGAVEAGMRDWETATAALTPDDWGTLAAFHADELLADAETLASVASAGSRLDMARIHGSTARLLATLDVVAPALQEAATEVAPVERAPLFPGPNEGVLFNDPFNLILVGDVGRSVYRGNTWVFPNIDPWEHILIIDLGGEDEYRNHPATAHPGLCTLGNCGNGVPLSVVLDLTGDDLYLPTNADGGSTGFGIDGGVGILLDLSGNDRYVAPGVSQGYGSFGVGLLLEASGSDTYAGGSGSQGRTSGASSMGALLDVQGDDHYGATGFVSQAASTEGTAVLADLQGNDVLSSTRRSQANAFQGGVALLLNVGGNDAYSSWEESRGYAGPCWDPSLPLPTCPMGMDDFLAGFLDVCGSDTYAGWLGADDTIWQQNQFGVGADMSDPVLCTGND